MGFSKKYWELLQNFNFSMLNSNFLLSNLRNIEYCILDENNKPTLSYDNYLNKPLSLDMLKLIETWKNQIFLEDLFLILNDNLKQLVQNDTTKYSAQIFFPLYVKNKLAGLAIFFRTNGNYISSSIKSPQTIRNFLQDALNKE